MASARAFTYFGTSDFSRRVLEGLLRAGLAPALVVTTAPKPRGRGWRVAPTPVAEAARADLPLLEVPTLRGAAVHDALRQRSTEFALLAAFGKIIPPAVLAIYRRGIINVHPSLLPRYRGPSPIQAALLDGCATTGVTLIMLDSEIDHGPVLAQAELAITEADDAPSLAAKLADRSVELVRATLPLYLGNQLTPMPQDHTKATFTTVIRRSDGQADFSRGAAELDRVRRAFAPWPGLWTTWQGKLLKLIATAPLAGYRGELGRVARAGGNVVVGCASGGLQITKVQTEGGRVVAARDFILGHPSFVGAQLG